MKRKPFMIQGLCLGMILFGMHSCFHHTLFPYASLLKFTAPLFLAAVWFTLLSVNPFSGLEQRIKKRFRISFVKCPMADFLVLLTLVLLAVYLWNHAARIQQDARILSDAFFYHYDRYYGNARGHFFLEDYTSNGSRLLFSAELLLAFYMAKAFTGRSGMFLGTLPAAALLSGCLLLGKTPEISDMICMACGVLGIQMVTDGIRLGGRKGFRQRTTGGRQHQRGYVLAAILLAVACSVSSILSFATADTCLRGEQDLLEIQNKMERRVVDASVRMIQKIIMMLGIKQPGIMTNVAPSYTGETVLTIVTDQKPETDLYLRGFIGTKYEDGRWSTSASEELQELNRYMLLTQDYDAVQTMVEKMQEDVFLSTIPSCEPMKMRIEYAEGNRSGFGYLPYYSRLADESTGYFLMDGDYRLRRDSSVKEYMVDGINMDPQTEGALLKETVMWRQGRDLDEYIPYTGNPELEEDWRTYWDYVLTHDTWLPEKGLERTKELVQNLVDSREIQLYDVTEGWDYNAAQIIGQLRHFLWSTTTYSQNLKLKLSREDYVENFLFEQKKGYCEHYATAGAVLFRAMGMPARYVSGYKVSAQDFKDNDDGTYAAKVIDSKAHAWTEVYTYHRGWTVADMTPPDNRQNVIPSRDANDMISYTESPDDNDDEFLDSSQDSSEQVSPEEEITPTPEITDLPEETDRNGGSETPEAGSGALPPESGGAPRMPGEGGTAAKGMLQWAALALLCCGSLVLLWHLQASLRHRQLKRCKSRREYILRMNRLLERYLRCCGYRGVSKMEDGEYIELLGELYPAGRDKGTLKRYYRLLEQARFAREAGNPEEIRWCKKLFYRLGSNVIQQCSGPRRFYVRWIRNWRRKKRKNNRYP